jgi:tight adherence protein B
MRSARRFIVTVALAIAVLVVSAGPALAQTTGGETDQFLVLVGAIGVGGALFLIIILLTGNRAAVERDLQERLGHYASASTEATGRFKNPLLRRFVRGAESAAQKRGLLGNIETALDQANIPLRPGEAIAGALAVAILAAIFMGLVMQSLLGALIGAGVALMLASAAVNFVARRERNQFISQLPDTLNLISTSLRAGYSLLQALEAVASEAQDPTAREFGRALNETRLGRSPVDSLKDVGERMESVDFDWAVLAISIQREVGGNLAEVLQTAAETMLHRNRLRAEMKALTAEGRISAIVLGAMPFLLFGFLFTSNRSYLEPLFDRTPGLIAMGAGVVLLVAGVVWLTRIVKIEI